MDAVGEHAGMAGVVQQVDNDDDSIRVRYVYTSLASMMGICIGEKRDLSHIVVNLAGSELAPPLCPLPPPPFI